MAQSFFSPNAGFGTLTGWELQTSSLTTGKTRESQLGSTGDEIGKKLHDVKYTLNAVYTLKTAKSCKIPKFGEILGGWHTDSVAIAFSNTGFVQMTLNGHRHTTSTTAHSTGKTYTGTLTSIASEFGCPSTFTGITIPTGAGVRSATYTLTGTHTDELGSAGDWLASGNNDGNETLNIELADDSVATGATSSVWDITDDGTNGSNTGMTTTSVTAVHHLSADSAS